MATPSAVFTEMVTTTDRSWSNRLADNVSNNNALMYKMKDGNKIKTVSGGYEITEQLEYGENSTYQRYAGYDQLDTDASDVLTSAKYPFQQVALHVTASGRELRMNMGKERMINLVEARRNNAIKTAVNQFSVDLYGSGALNNQIGGLANIIQTDGQGVVGGIDSATFTFWRNQFQECAATVTSKDLANSIAFRGDMNQLWLKTVRMADKPDLIVMSHDFYALYEIAEQDKQRYADSKLAENGFDALKYKSADVVFDDNANFSTTAERAYFLNTDYLYLVQHREAQWTPDAEKKPVNQDAVVIPFYWMGNLVCTNRSLQGILIDES